MRRLLLAILAAALTVGASRPAGSATVAVDLMALNPEIERFIDQRIRSTQSRSTRVRGLMDVLFGRKGLDIAYGTLETKTAVETFESRSGNCLSFTILFVALARHVGLEAHFQEVGEILSWDRRGDVAVLNRHMFAEVETGDGVARVDFLPGIEKRYRLVRRIGEQRVLAHYYSNLGAEALTENDLERALEMFNLAVEADDSLAGAWVNMGVTHRRLGNREAAETNYLRALELDPNEISAASNLAALYHASGRGQLAGPYMRQVRKHRRRNPFHHFRRGLEAASQGDLQTATQRLRKAARLLPDDAMFRAELAKVLARAGRPKKAERNFQKALRLTDDEAERILLEGLLENVRTGAA